MLSSIINQYIESQNINISLNLLPMFHSCEGYDGVNIFKDRLLKATPCNVFKGEDLLYFFYGKPAYPVSANYPNATEDEQCLPVCFIVNSKMVNLYRVFPFDSGAFKGGKYDKFMHKHATIENFELDNNLEEINKYIAFMFGTNEKYILGDSNKKDINLTKADDLDMNALIRLNNACGAMDLDERKHTVEVITKDNIELKDALECVILPQNLLMVEEIQNFLTKNKIQYKTYITRRYVAPVLYNQSVFEKSMEYLVERKVINYG